MKYTLPEVLMKTQPGAEKNKKPGPMIVSEGLVAEKWFTIFDQKLLIEKCQSCCQYP
jgi:hypothetical protein